MRRRYSRRNQVAAMSGTEIALIVGGVAAVGVVGYLIWNASQPAGAPGTVSLPGTSGGAPPCLSLPNTAQCTSSCTPNIDWDACCATSGGQPCVANNSFPTSPNTNA
jgi:hypothetical protein